MKSAGPCMFQKNKAALRTLSMFNFDGSKVEGGKDHYYLSLLWQKYSNLTSTVSIIYTARLGSEEQTMHDIGPEQLIPPFTNKTGTYDHFVLDFQKVKTTYYLKLIL